MSTRTKAIVVATHEGVTEDDMEDYILEEVSIWHASDEAQELNVPIYEFLGVTREEYGSWVEGKKTFLQIAQDRKSRCN